MASPFYLFYLKTKFEDGITSIKSKSLKERINELSVELREDLKHLRLKDYIYINCVLSIALYEKI